MSIAAIEQAFREFADAGGNLFERAAEDPNLFEEVLESLGLVAPPDLSAFYGRYDCVAFGPVEFLSIDELAQSAAQFSTKRGRYLPIIADDAGGVFVVACHERGRRPDSEFGNVLYLPWGRFDVAELKATNFTDFVRRKVEFWMEDL